MITAFELEDLVEEPDFINGDLVAVQGSVYDDDGIEITGFKGRVISKLLWTHQSGDCVYVKWSLETLDNCPEDYFTICEELGVPYAYSLVSIDYLVMDLEAWI